MRWPAAVKRSATGCTSANRGCTRSGTISIPRLPARGESDGWHDSPLPAPLLTWTVEGGYRPASVHWHQALLLESDAEVVRVRRRRQRVPQGDQTVLEQVEQRLVEGLHAVVLALGDDLLNRLLVIGLEDAVEDPSRHHHDFNRRHPALAVGTLEEALAHDAFQRGRQGEANLLLLERREEVDDAVDRFGGIGRVEGGQDKVARLRG